MRFGSLFAGIGGIDLGLERAGMECMWQVEKDPYCLKVLKKHWPDVQRHTDVHDFPPEDIKSLEVDLIAGGFPCQNISEAGDRKGLDGQKSSLFFEMLRVIREFKPRYALLENVSALLRRGMGRVLGELAKIGYDSEWHCIPAASVGAPHRRDRAFIIAYANSTGLQGLGEMEGFSQICSKETLSLCYRGGRSGQWGTKPDVPRMVNGIPSRVDRTRALGNAVVPLVAKYIGERILDYDLHIELMKEQVGRNE